MMSRMWAPCLGFSDLSILQTLGRCSYQIYSVNCAYLFRLTSTFICVYVFVPLRVQERQEWWLQMSPTEGSQYRNWLYRQRKNRKVNEGGERQNSRTLVPTQKEAIVCLGSWNHSKLQERRWKGEGPSCKTGTTVRRTQGRKASQKGMERLLWHHSSSWHLLFAPMHPLAKLPSSQRATEPGEWGCLQDGAESVKTEQPA